MPLGIRDKAVDAALDAMSTLQVGAETRLAVRLVNRGRAAELPKLRDGYDRPARWADKASLAETLAPGCAAALGLAP